MQLTRHPPSSPGPERLINAATVVLAEAGWDGLTLQAVADQAGVSRVTVWRQLSSRDHLVSEMLRRLAVDYQTTLWPIITGSGSGASRLNAALDALCDVADRHLPLLLASDAAFGRDHQAIMHTVRFAEPIVRLLRDAAADGSLSVTEDPEVLGDVVFSAVYWAYVHLRGRHGRTAAQVKALLLPLIAAGLQGAHQASTSGQLAE